MVLRSSAYQSALHLTSAATRIYQVPYNVQGILIPEWTTFLAATWYCFGWPSILPRNSYMLVSAGLKLLTVSKTYSYLNGLYSWQLTIILLLIDEAIETKCFAQGLIHVSCNGTQTHSHSPVCSSGQHILTTKYKWLADTMF